MAGTGVGKFSSTASNNTSNLTVNFAENMAPSNVNNAARELMGHMRDMYEQLGDGYFEFGDGDGEYTVTRGDADTITITGTGDITSVYYVGRKIRITDGGANVVEGVISGSSHSSTTQTIDLSGISLASGTPTKVELGIDTAAFGGKVILDDDGDTYIEAPTDDTIDIYVAGAKDFVITANTFTAESGSTIAAQALTATTVTASGEIDGGSLDISGDADIDGTTNLDVVDIDGAVNMATTALVTGVLTTTATAVFNGGFTSNDGVTISTADVNPQLTIISTEAGGDQAPLIDLYRNSSSPADADVLGQIRYYGENSADEKIEYVRVRAGIADVTDGDEGGNYTITSFTAGSQFGRLNIKETETVFNENSADIDFRVESNSLSHMLFVDANTDKVAIGHDTPTAMLHVKDNANDAVVRIESTDADANVGPILDLFRNSASAGDDDNIGDITFTGNDNAGNLTTYMRLDVRAADATNGDEDGFYKIEMPIAGTDVEFSRAGAFGHVFNENGTDNINFRVESNTDATCFVVNGAADAVLMGIGTEYSGTGAKLTVTPSIDVGDTGLTGTAAIQFIRAASTGVIGGIYGKWAGYGSGGYIKFNADNVGGGSQTSSIIMGTTLNNSESDKFIIAGNGDLTAVDTSIGSISDERLKENIADFNYDISKFKQLKPRSYKWKNPIYHGSKVDENGDALTSYGTIAQEVEAVDSDYVRDFEIKEEVNPDKDLLNVDNIAKTTTISGKEHAMYISVIQQLIARIEALEA